MKERFPHQKEWFEKTKDMPGFAFFWEMRCAKTLPNIDTAVYLFEKKKISAVLVIAPSGVHTNWARIAILEERPEDKIIEWSGKAGNKSFQAMLELAIEDKSTLLWICINCESIITDLVKEMMHNLAEARPTMLIVDESHDFKTPGASRTKALSKRDKKFPFRRILSGTPAPSGPFDYFSQFRILDENILGKTFADFKQRYGVFDIVRFGAGRAFPQLKKYKDLDMLMEKVSPYMSRLTKKVVHKNLPPVINQIEHFIMSKEQQRCYDQMKEEMLVELDNGLVLTATQAFVQLLRLQQITRGYIGMVDGEVHKIEGQMPSLETLGRVIDQAEGKIIIWCRFKQDVTEVMNYLSENYKDSEAVRYDGNVDKETRFSNKDKFMIDEDTRFLVGTPGTGGVGIDLSVADTMVHYSHNYDLVDRMQSSSRFENLMKVADKLLMIDIVAADSKDIHCLERLAAKEDLQATLTGDKLRRMLREQG